METLQKRDLVWPERRFGYVPTLEVADQLAQEVWDLHAGRAMTGIMEQLDIEIRFRDLTGARALLVPNISDGQTEYQFIVLCDPSRHNDFTSPLFSSGLNQGDYVDFSLGHELGHTFFYSWEPGGAVAPRPLSRSTSGAVNRNDKLEEWCDTFSAGLMYRL